MTRRSLPALALLIAVGGCGVGPPPNPTIGFEEASAQPLMAPLDEVVAVGGRVLDGDAVESLVATMGEDAFLQGIGGIAEDRLLVRPDGAACIGEIEGGDCHWIVADGTRYRVFTLAGEAAGTLTPSAG
jgi:hypothetical protein